MIICFWIITHLLFWIISFLSIKLLKECHRNLFTQYIVYYLFFVCFDVFLLAIIYTNRSNSFSTRTSSFTYVHGVVTLTLLILKNSSDHFGMTPFAKVFLFIYILTWSLISNFGFLCACSTSKFIYVHVLTSAGFIVIVLWYILLYLLVI